MMGGSEISLTSQPMIPMSDIAPEETPQTFECSLALLQQIVHELEEGNLGLEPSLSRFDRSGPSPRTTR